MEVKMKKIFFLIFILNINLFSYEKINFIGNIIENNLQNSVSLTISKGKIYILSDSFLNIYDSSFTFLSKIDLKTRKSISITYGDEFIYILDYSIPRIDAVNEKGEIIFSFGSAEGKEGSLSSPKDIKYFNDQKIYVANTGLSRIEVFNKYGIYLYGFNTIKSDGITKLKPSKICLDKTGYIYLTDPDKQIVQKYDRMGRLIIEKNYRANSIAVNEYGIIYLANEKDGKIIELDRNLNIINTLGTKGKGKFEFLSFQDITVDTKNHIFILDNKNKKLLTIELENSLYKEKLPDYSILDKINIVPDEIFKISPFSFDITENNSIIYYDKNIRKGYLLNKEEKKDLLTYGQLEGQVKDPSNVLYSDGKIYVCDTGNSKVQIYNKEGKYLNYFGGKVGFLEKNKEGKFNTPISLFLNSKGKLYIADTGTNMIQTFSEDGIFLFSIGPNISNIKLMKIADIKGDEANNLYILDSELKKIIITDADGKYINSFNINDIEEPVSFDYDGYGFFYFLDKINSKIKIYDKKGNYQTAFFTKGHGERELYEPNIIKIKNGKLYIADPYNNKLAVFKISYIPERPASLVSNVNNEKIELSWQIPNPKIIKQYKIFRGTNSDKVEYLNSSDKLSYTDKNLEENTTYYYLISAISVSGEENYSQIIPVYFKGKEKVKIEDIKSEEINKNKPPVEIIPIELNYIFSANYKYYLNNPIGKILVKNNTDEKFNNLKVSFFLKDYMDFPTDTILTELPPQTSTYVSLKATLNNKILSINEDTPIQAQLSISYYRNEKENSFSLNQPIKILSKNAITWDNSQRIANFITIKDPPVVSFSRIILNQQKDFEDENRLDPNLINAIIIWENLGNYGLTYLADPINPYSSIKISSQIITDTVQFPRSTLKLKSGDCDDLTVLFATLFESNGMRTMILDYPGHIALMFETQAKNKSEVGIPEDYIIEYEGKYFIPIETTMVGKNFYDSVVYAFNMYKQYSNDVRIFELRTAMTKFEPVTLPDTSDEIKYDNSNVSEKISKTIENISYKKLSYYENLYKQALKENPDDINSLINLGVLYATYNKLDEAQKIFEEIISKDSYNASAFNNLGNTYFLKKEYDNAIENYMKATKIDPFDENIFLNIARAYVKKGKNEDAKIFIERAIKLNPEIKSIADNIIK